MEDAVLEEVRQRQLDLDCADGTDIAAMLGEARYEDGSPMTEQDLRDELVTLLTDGPTSSLLSWSFERILCLERPAGTYTWIPFGGACGVAWPQTMRSC